MGTDIDDPDAVGIQDLEHRYLWGDRVDQLLAHEALKKKVSNPNVTDFTLEGDVDWPLLDHQNSIRDVAECGRETGKRNGRETGTEEKRGQVPFCSLELNWTRPRFLPLTRHTTS